MKNDYSTHAALLADAKGHLLLMRDEMSLNENEAVIVSRGIAAIERFTLLAEMTLPGARP